jgi:hypothetical protein
MILTEGTMRKRKARFSKQGKTFQVAVSISWEKYEPRDVVGYEAKLPGYENWQWFVSPDLGRRGYWVVSEVSTGARVPHSRARTRQLAADRALTFVDKAGGVATMAKSHRKALRMVRMPKRKVAA